MDLWSAESAHRSSVFGLPGARSRKSADPLKDPIQSALPPQDLMARAGYEFLSKVKERLIYRLGYADFRAIGL